MTHVRLAALLAATALIVSLGAASSAWATNGAAAWGRGSVGQLGDGSKSKATVPTTVYNLSEVKAVAAGGDHSLALMKNGTVEAWGDNEEGQLGDGTTVSSDVPVTVTGLHEVVEVAAAEKFSLALLANGKVMAWGTNRAGELETGGPEYSDVAVERPGLTEVTAISAGGTGVYGYGLALLKNGTVKSWGSNTYATLGVSTEAEALSTPVEVNELTEVVAISAGVTHGLALLANGTVKAWGINPDGELGNGTETGPDKCPLGFKCWRTPTTTIELSEVASISAGGRVSMALLTNGTVKTWGGPYTGREGKSDVPAPLKSVSEAAQVSAGANHNLVLLANGTVEAWGQDESGQVGIGVSGFGKATSVPTPVGELSGVEGVSAGDELSLSFGSPGPLVTKLEPDQGTSAGGTKVEITGTNLTGLKAVSFGASAASSFSASSSTLATATSPAKKPSTVPVTVLGADGITSAPDTASSYTYVPEGELELGRCESVGAGKGHYKAATCVELAEGGKFEWMPGATNPSFTIADATEKLGKPKPISLASSHATLSCEDATGSGSYLGNKAVTGVVVRFTGCTLGGSKCSSAGAAEGEVASYALEGGLGWREKAANAVGLDLGPSGEEELVLEATCGSSTVKARGAAIAFFSPVNKMTSSFTLKFKVSKGVQTPEHFEGEANEFYELSVGGGAYEQAALTFEGNVTNKEELEINTIV